MTAPFPFVPTVLMAKLAVGEMFALTPIAQSISVAALLSTAFVANVPDMFESAGEWDSMSSKLDTVGAALDQAKDDDGQNWVADDKQAFTDAVVDYKAELENAKSMCSMVSGVLLGIAIAYATYWMLVIALLAVATVALIACAALYFTPVAPAAKAQAEAIGAFISATIGIAGKVALATFIAAGAIFTGAGVALIGAHWGVKGYGGEKGADFKQATVDWKPPSTFEAKPKS